MSTRGIVYLVGAGPGDAGLLTLRGAELLRRAEVVIYDGLVNRDLLQLSPASAEIIYGGKHNRTHCVSQEELNALLLAKAREGKRVVRLKGGDPCLFGRGGEEAEVLAEAGIPFEIVPGVSSIQAVPSYAGIPLTHRHHTSSVVVVTGHEAPSSPSNRVDWAQLAKLPGTLVVLMGLKNIRQIAVALVAHGRPPGTPAAIISHGTTGRQKSVAGTLADIAALAARAGLSPPAVTVIGDVVNLRDKLNWFERRPLFGRRVVVTQRSHLAGPLLGLLGEHGAQVLQVPASRFAPPADTARLDRAIAQVKSYHWIIFSNPSSVEIFFERFFRTHDDWRELGGARLAAYGPVTAGKLRELHLHPAAVAADHKPQLIVAALAKCCNLSGQRILLLRGQYDKKPLPEALCKLGALVDDVACYAAKPETADPTGDAARLVEEGADWVVFASGLSIKHFHERFDLPQLLARFPGMKIALTTHTSQWALDRLGLTPAAVAATPHDVGSLVNEIIAATLRNDSTDVSPRSPQQWSSMPPPTSRKRRRPNPVKHLKR